MSKIIFAQSKNLKPPLRRFQYILYCSIPIKMSSTNWNTTNIGYFLWLSRFMFFVVERLYGPYKRWIICSQTNRGMRYKFQIDFRLLVWSLWRHVFVRNIKNPNSFLKKFFLSMKRIRILPPSIQLPQLGTDDIEIRLAIFYFQLV